MSESCIFCRIAKGEIPSSKVFETEKIFAFKDIEPKAPTHILIIPKEHFSTLNDLENSPALVGEMLCSAAKIAKDFGIEKTGYRTILNCNSDGGQEVYHVHLHLLGGKKLKTPF